MLRIIWREIEPRVQALVTERILLFHKALVRRGQIQEAPGELPMALPAGANVATSRLKGLREVR